MSNPSQFYPDGLYNVALGSLPIGLLVPWLNQTPWPLFYSRHAQQAVLDDRYGRLTKAPQELLIKLDDVFECEVLNGHVVKVCVRLQRGYEVDLTDIERTPHLCLVLIPAANRPGTLFVKTLWLNDGSDNHSTLNKNNYANQIHG